MTADRTVPPAAPSGHSFGSITNRINALLSEVADLNSAYESDASVAQLATVAAGVRDLAASLTSVLYDTDTALNGL
jgi:hypothetical protein